MERLSSTLPSSLPLSPVCAFHHKLLLFLVLRPKRREKVELTNGVPSAAGTRTPRAFLGRERIPPVSLEGGFPACGGGAPASPVGAPPPPVAGSPKTPALPQKGQKSVPRARSFHERFSRRVAVFKAPLCRLWRAGGSARGPDSKPSGETPALPCAAPRISLTGKGSGGQQR